MSYMRSYYRLLNHESRIYYLYEFYVLWTAIHATQLQRAWTLLPYSNIRLAASRP
jgi:hypothetical protein